MLYNTIQQKEKFDPKAAICPNIPAKYTDKRSFSSLEIPCKQMPNFGDKVNKTMTDLICLL